MVHVKAYSKQAGNRLYKQDVYQLILDMISQVEEIYSQNSCIYCSMSGVKEIS